jgi:hypothetical protein
MQAHRPACVKVRRRDAGSRLLEWLSIGRSQDMHVVAKVAQAEREIPRDLLRAARILRRDAVAQQ